MNENGDEMHQPVRQTEPTENGTQLLDRAGGAGSHSPGMAPDEPCKPEHDVT